MKEKKSLWGSFKEALSNTDLNAPCVIGKPSQEDIELIRAYNESKYGKNIIHLHQHNYYLIDKKTGKKLVLDPNRYEIKEETIEAEAEEV